MVLDGEERSARIPVVFGSAEVPAGFVPMRDAMTALPPATVISMPVVKRLIARARTRRRAALDRQPDRAATSGRPLISISGVPA